MAQSLKTYIMCGGSGTRLWPLSRADNPKQMLSLFGEKSMLEITVDRAAAMPIDADISVSVIGSSGQRDLLSKIPGVGSVLVEPHARNTTAAVVLAALDAQNADDPYVLILPSDHIISTTDQFAESVSRGMQAADGGRIVVFGIEPDTPATGYGYIEADDNRDVSKVARFVEKPDLATAQTYLASGRHLWNAGIFLARASTLIAELALHAPDILDSTRRAFDSADQDGKIVEFDPDLYGAIRSQSIDYAVMEQSANVSMVRAGFAWSDVGSFAALKDSLDTDDAGNALQGDVIAVDSQRNLLRSEGPLITALGVSDLAVVATPDTVFVAPLKRSEEVKAIVSRLEAADRPELRQTSWSAEGGVVPGAMCEKLRHWLFDDALPFWMRHGLDTKAGGFHEVLDFKGKSTGADKRLRTMARQVYVFAKASEMGWAGDADKVINHGLDFLEQAQTAPRGGWFKTFDRNSKPVDKTEDVYDHAFILLAMAEAVKTGNEIARPIAQRVLAFLSSMEVQTPGEVWNGYYEDDLGTLPRRANPHMHLLEAFLAWHEASGDETALVKAAQIVGLFREHFCCRDTGFLREEFDAVLQPDDSTSRHMEPGHHFEWAWLLERYANLSGETMSSQMFRLVASAKAFGINPVSQLAHDRIEEGGKPSHETSRCWPQTELLKADLALARNGMPHAAFAAERTAQRLWKCHIAPAPTGMWMDVCDVAGNPVAKSVPASTFYHLVCALDEYLGFHAEK